MLLHCVHAETRTPVVAAAYSHLTTGTSPRDALARVLAVLPAHPRPSIVAGIDALDHFDTGEPSDARSDQNQASGRGRADDRCGQNRRVDGVSAVVRSAAELLAATDCANVDELVSQVDGEVDLDGSVDVEPDGVTLIVDWFWAVTLRYPFTIQQFWRTLDEMDSESLAAYEAFDQEGSPDDGGFHPVVRNPVHRFVLAREG